MSRWRDRKLSFSFDHEMGEWHELTIKTSEENMEKEEDDKNDEKQYAAHHHLLALRTRSMTNPRLQLTMVASGFMVSWVLLEMFPAPRVLWLSAWQRQWWQS